MHKDVSLGIRLSGFATQHAVISFSKRISAPRPLEKNLEVPSEDEHEDG